tara:strand:+ start:94 stop:1050 length:957 start_codon:yes stop_codon:yes gene_type:complete
MIYTFDLSLVIPVLNEEENIKELYNRISSHLEHSGLQYEIIFVDDCSSDKSYEIIKSLSIGDNSIKAIRFSRKFGYQESIYCGLENSNGNYIITMDSDLQHPPEYILDLIKKSKEGYDIVNMVRRKKTSNSLIKKLGSSFFYKIINYLSPTSIVNESADFRLYTRKAINKIKLFPEKGLFIRGLVGWIGFKQVDLMFEEQKRRHGKSKFNIIRLIRFALKAITSFSTSPLYFSIYTGFLLSSIGITYGLLITIRVLFLNEVYDKGWVSIISLLLFIGGLIMIMLGIIGVYLSVIFKEIKMRPRYIIDKEIGFDKNTNS